MADEISALFRKLTDMAEGSKEQAFEVLVLASARHLEVQDLKAAGDVLTSVKARFDAQLSAADPANISGKVKSTGARESEPAGPAPAPAPKIPTPEPAPKTPTREPVTPKKPSKAGGNHEKSFDTPNIHSVIGKSLQRINFKSPVKDDIVEAVTPTKANKGSPFKRRRTNNSDSN